MTTINQTTVSSATITARALAAHRALSRGDDSQLSQLLELLNPHREKWIATTVSKYPSLDRADLESAYMFAVWDEVKRYRSADKGGFLRILSRAITSRAYDLLDRDKHVREDQESLDHRVEAAGDAALPYEASEEDLFILRETLNGTMDSIRALDPRMDADKRALHRTRIERGLSINEAVNVASGIYRNRQQMWRDVKRHESRIERAGR